MTAILASAWRHRLWIAVAVALLLYIGVDDASARVGGGQSHSSGSRSSGGSSYGGGGGGGGGDGDLLFLLLWLVIEHPAIGVPVLVLVLAFFGFRAVIGASIRGSRTRYVDGGPHHNPYTPARETRPATTSRLDAIESSDPGFSWPALQDWLQLVHRRATEAAAAGQWDPLAPFVSPEARERLARMHEDVRTVDEVVLAGMKVVEVRADARRQTLSIRFLGSRLETLKNGSQRRSYAEEDWTFRRPSGLVSPAPDKLRRIGCPSCGSAIETDRMGACRNCGTVIGDGRMHWQASEVSFVVARRPIDPPLVELLPGGIEESATWTTVVDPNLGVAVRGFVGRHREFDFKQFETYVREVFFELQNAWSAGQWERARPHTTDTLFQSLRFFIDNYARRGLTNRLEDIRVERVQVVRIKLDAWYEAITVRIWASMKDSVVDRNGAVVGGNPLVDRKFSEYWTFLRAAGGDSRPKDPHHCPSCGAALDRIAQTGVCGYCDSKITTGDFNWVLSRIDQPDSYSG